MQSRIRVGGVAAFAAVSILAASCSSSGDDGAEVRNLDGETGEPVSASASGSASGSASASAPATGSASSSGPAETGGEMTTGDGGYDYASNVDSHRLVVNDICPMGELLDAGDFAAVDVLYREGGSSVKGDGSLRTIAGFAARDDKLHGLDEYYGTPTPLDDFVTAALEGTGVFEGESDAVRGQGVEKGIQNQVMVAWVQHEMNAALAKAADGNFDPAEGAPHNWDEGWAFYHGASPGCAPFATADKRAGNFGTLGEGETSMANEAILAAMIAGRDALVAEDMAGAEDAAAEINKQFVVTYSQASIRYASKVIDDLAADDAETARVHQAEGYAFFRVIENLVADNGGDVDAINAILHLDNEPGANGGPDEVIAALTPAWDALGITADDIGTLES